MTLSEQNIQFLNSLFYEITDDEIAGAQKILNSKTVAGNGEIDKNFIDGAKQAMGNKPHTGGLAETVKQHVANITGKVTNTVQHAKDYATGAGQKAAQHVGTAVQHAKEYAGAGAQHLTDAVSHHPVAAGVLGAAGLYGAHKATGG
jgi:hypothetical protein